MKFVKENLTLVICGVVVLLAIAFAWYAKGPFRSDLFDSMNNRLSALDTINELKNTDLQLTGNAPLKGPPSEAWINAKTTLIGTIKAQREEVAKRSDVLNRQGRITSNGIPILPLLPNGKPEPNCLPKLGDVATAHQFKDDYGTQFKIWTGFLAFGEGKPVELDSAAPPEDAKLELEYTAAQEQKKQTMGAVLTTSGLGNSDAKEKSLYKQNKVLSRANDVRMYVDSTAFQIAPWFATDSPPNDQQVFGAMIESWLQADVVRAIAAVNTSASPTGKNISKSPVKRLIHITVGNSARNRQSAPSQGGMGAPTGPVTGVGGDLTDLFYTNAAAQSVGGMTVQPLVNPGGGPAPVQPAEPNKVNYDMGMTGHSSGGTYDVVQMSIWMDIDPAAVNQFMDQLYRQNMGYTWVITHAKTVDPIDRVSFGYLYGESQALEVQIQVEAIFFRSWTSSLMPSALRASLGVPEPAAAPK